MSETDRLRAELRLALQRAHTAEAQRADTEAELFEARARVLRDEARASRAQAEAAAAHLAVAEVRRLCQMTISTSVRTHAMEQARDTLAALEAITPDTALPGDEGWFTVWLHSDWRYLTENMTTSEREHAADAVARYNALLSATDGADRPEEPECLRWWRG